VPDGTQVKIEVPEKEESAGGADDEKGKRETADPKGKGTKKDKKPDETVAKSGKGKE
jgi:hypothetical protein